MSEIEQYTLEGYASPDPNDINRTILTFKVSVFNPVIEAGFVPKFAKMKNWDGEGSPCDGISNWLKREAYNCGKQIYLANAIAQRTAEAEAEFDSMS